MSAEAVKRESGYLAGEIATELAGESVKFEHDAELLLKFHGVYQQDDRDVRRHRVAAGLEPDYSCMVRASVPGGVITREQWLALDRLAGITNDTLRLTTRQGVQYHVVHKEDLRTLVAGINSSLLTTLGACGDVVRNVMACPLPHPERRAILDPVVDELVARFRPRTESYWELWVDGECAVSAEPPAIAQPVDEVEPLYGDAYLPRKFKIGVAWPGDNCVDIYTHDVGVVPTLTEGTSGELTGFVVLAGGGMGMSHQRSDDTYPLLARPIGWVLPEYVADVVEAIVATQRDHGNREDRSRARLKYLLEERGVDWLRAQIAERTGRPLDPPVELPQWEVHTHHGWHEIEGPKIEGPKIVVGIADVAVSGLMRDGSSAEAALAEVALGDGSAHGERSVVEVLGDESFGVVSSGFGSSGAGSPGDEALGAVSSGPAASDIGSSGAVSTCDGASGVVSSGVVSSRDGSLGAVASSAAAFRAISPGAERTFALGLPVPSGTVDGIRRTVLRRLVADGVVRELRVTPRQDLLLCGIAPSNVDTVETVLRAARVPLASDQSPTRNLAIACPALPTCGKALGEAERVLPDVVDRLEKLLADTGNANLPLRLNMTGCPNGCSRPYAAELGIVGRSKKTYDMFVGGSPSGDRLARRLRADVHLDDLPAVLRPLLDQFRSEADDGTSFGDWVAAQAPHRLEELLPPPDQPRRRRG